MSHIKSELEQAKAEVKFWRDFVCWWEAKYKNPADPRISEALSNAEIRFELSQYEIRRLSH
jgi:hypothetical protein